MTQSCHVPLGKHVVAEAVKKAMYLKEEAAS